MGTIKDLKYKLIKNFLTIEEVNLLTNYCRIKHRINCKSFDDIQNDNGDTFFYGDPLMESLMVNKLELMKKETGLELLPTYAFWRMYTLNADLKKHKDREACEISVTVMIGSDKTKWPIYLEPDSTKGTFDSKNNEYFPSDSKGIEINLNPGDALIYLGCELEHWRKEFEGDWHAQTFLHYVDKNGKNVEWFKDKRILYGVVK
jgi:hypothetical protein